MADFTIRFRTRLAMFCRSRFFALLLLGMAGSSLVGDSLSYASAADDSVVPIIPEWLHEAAHQEGRQIRVVTVNSTAETRTVMCIGCKKDMLAATNVQLVFCPCCGTTFSPNDLYAFE